jgi:hypothetical protein
MQVAELQRVEEAQGFASYDSDLPTIVVVEDYDGLRSAYRDFLQNNKFNVVTAKRRELLPDGVEFADLVISSRALPGETWPNYVDAADWASAKLTPHGVRVGFVSSPLGGELIGNHNRDFRPDFELEQVVECDDLLAAIRQSLKVVRITNRGTGRDEGSE